MFVISKEMVDSKEVKNCTKAKGNRAWDCLSLKKLYTRRLLRADPRRANSHEFLDSFDTN